MSELYIVEGDSAGGSAKQGRNRKMQAILPLKGKILNVERARFDKMLSSQEVGTLITALGTGIGPDEYNPDKLRYHKIIIMTDADVDGSHIRTLLLTFFFRQMPELVERGYIYIAQPPLYQIKRKKREEYVDDDIQLNNILISLGAEELKLIDLSVKKEFTPNQFKEVLDLLERLEKYSAAIRRLGGDFQNYLNAISPQGVLPTYLVVVRSGNTEHVEYFHNEAELRDFSLANSDLNLFEVTETEEEEAEEKEVIVARSTVTKLTAKLKRRARLLEIHESKGVEKLIGELARRGMNIAHYSDSAEPLFHMIDGDTTHDVFSIPRILEIVKEVGRRGVQIKRFKGLGEMNAKELYQTTMNPERRRFLKVELNEDNSFEAGRMFNLLMGEVVEPRRIFIEDNALNVRNLDV
jgi:DNA gyrase subunit B